MLELANLFNLRHSEGYRVISHCGSMCISPKTNDTGQTFMYLSLIWMVNFICQCIGLRDAQRTGKILFLGLSVKAFLEEISI
jgi:hypothetical protein